MIRVFALMVAISAPLFGQNSNTNVIPPQIAVSSRGEVKVNPDRATVQISVQTKASTASAAASENASKLTAVIQALRGLGLRDKDISTSDYNVSPEQRYEPNKEPVIVGYTVTNTLALEVVSLKMVGPVIDAALAKGANMVTSLQFVSSSTEAARRDAIALAVGSARSDAEAAAKAAGGSIGGLLEISIGSYSAPPPRPFDAKVRMAMASSDQTPINAGEQTVSVDVSTRWVFVGPGK